MASRVATTTFNCADAYALSQWWKEVLEYTDIADDPNEPGDEECVIMDASGGHRLLFIAVDDLQDVPGRVHLDLVPTDRRRDDEIERVLALRARLVADRRRPDGTGWMVLADPDGNQFCVVRSEEERAAAARP